MNKLKASLLALSIMLSMSLYAQKVDKQKTIKQQEIGLSTSVANLSQMSLIYRIGQPNTIWRLSLLNVTNVRQNVIDESSRLTHNNISAGIGIGKEFRKLVNDKFEFRLGGDITFQYSSSMSSSEDDSAVRDSKSRNQNLRPGINAVLGINYLINKHLIIGAELLPKAAYTITKSFREDDLGRTRIVERKGLTAQFSNQLVLLSLAYRL